MIDNDETKRRRIAEAGGFATLRFWQADRRTQHCWDGSHCRHGRRRQLRYSRKGIAKSSRARSYRISRAVDRLGRLSADREYFARRAAYFQRFDHVSRVVAPSTAGHFLLWPVSIGRRHFVRARRLVRRADLRRELSGRILQRDRRLHRDSGVALRGDGHSRSRGGGVSSTSCWLGGNSCVHLGIYDAGYSNRRPMHSR